MTQAAQLSRFVAIYTPEIGSLVKMMNTATRYQHTVDSFGSKKLQKIKEAKVLVVGAGGIGCEILKNLVLAGVMDIEVIDLDTIDVSNLNRQFLFRPQHVGMSKAIVAAEAAKAFNPEVSIKAHHGNIKNPKYGIEYFKKFSLVMNALDNIDARRHVNRVCLSSNVFLIDSGTTGYKGQVQPIKKGVTVCYECKPKQTPKEYPVCTIRSTPDQPVHCIVWAKELFKLLFGNPADSMLHEGEDSQELPLYMRYAAMPSTDTSLPDMLEHICSFLSAMYEDEIKVKLSMDAYKEAKKVPIPLPTNIFVEARKKVYENLTNSSASHNAASLKPSKGSNWDHIVWSSIDSAQEFIFTLLEVYHAPSATLLSSSAFNQGGSMVFDKDDEITMRFVTAAANLRMYVFGIPTESFYQLKGIAGNIIPAIATTNAIISGVQVLSAIKYITSEKNIEKLEDLKMICPDTYCVRYPSASGRYLQPVLPDNPNPGCYVCARNEQTIEIDTKVTTLQEFLNTVIKGHYGFNEPTVSLGSNTLYEEGEGADEDLQENLTKLLAECPGGGIKDYSELSVDDFSQDIELRIIVKHVNKGEFDEEKYPNFFRVVEKGSSNENIDITKKRKIQSEDITMEDDAKKHKASREAESNGDGEMIMIDLEDDRDDAAKGISSSGKNGREGEIIVL